MESNQSTESGAVIPTWMPTVSARATVGLPNHASVGYDVALVLQTTAVGPDADQRPVAHAARTASSVVVFPASAAGTPFSNMDTMPAMIVARSISRSRTRSTIMRPNLSSGRGNPATARRPRKPVSRQHGQPGGRRGTISSLPAKRRTEIEPLDRCRPRLVGAAPLFTGPSCQPLRQRAAQDGRQQVVLDPRVPRSVAFRSRGVGGAASIVPVARPEPPGTPSAPPPARWRLFPSNRRGTSSPTMRSAVCVTHRSLLAGNQFENVD